LDIDFLVKATKAKRVQMAQAFRLREDRMKMDDRFRKSWNQLRRRHTCLADVQQFILDRGIKPFASRPIYTPLFALDCIIAENERQREKLEPELDYQSEVLLGRYSSLERRHKTLMETRKYISGHAFPA
jgi:hypothetical protein